MGSITNCKFGGVVTDEHGEAICSKKGQGAVHGMTVAHLDKDDPSQFDIFLVFTGGATFDAGESSMKKVRCQKTTSGDMTVLKSEVFGRDLFEGTTGRPSTYGKADHDAGGDHAWPEFSCAEELCILCRYPRHWKPRQSRLQPCCWNFSVHAYKSLCTHSIHQDD